MKTKLIYFLKPVAFIILLLSVTVKIYAQANMIKNNLDKWRNDYPQEKIYLQTDKSYYVAGEDMWMKAWCTTIDGPTYLSRIIYIDIVDQKGTVVQKKMYQLDSLGSTAVNFSIPGNFLSGNYSVNAYTLWMLNFPEFISRKNIFIYGNDYKPADNISNKTGAKLQLSFFPEGGYIINGVENRIAFKATDSYGYPITVKGQIETEDGTKVTDISTEHNGMGVFEFQPIAGKKYSAAITSGGNSKLTFQLPVIKEEGINIKINNTNPNRLFILLRRGEKNKENFNELKIVTQLNYQVINTTMLNINEEQSAASISKKGLPPGILQITVFDKNNLPVAERIAFNENYSLVQPAIKNELKNLSAKGKNRISFNFDSTANSSISCLVTDYDASSIYEDNIASTLLFAAELKGLIFNEGYYIKDKDPVTLRHLDLLLMTQGWRRFNWKKINAQEPIALKYPVESAISFRGTMHKSDRTEIIKDGKVSFIIRGADSTSILAEANVTDKGEFMLSDINYKKDAEVAYMGTNNKKETFIVDVKLFPNYIDSLKKSNFKPTLNLDTTDLANGRSQLLLSLQAGLSLNDSAAKYKTLDNVILKARKVSKVDSLNNEYTSGVFQMGKSIDPQEFKNAFSIWQMLQQSVPGITVEGNPFDPTVSFNRFSGLAIAKPQTGEESSDPLSSPDVLEEGGIAYFINEVNVSKDVINSLSVSDIALIKVLKNEAAALGVTQGAIAFYTKTGKDFSARVYDKTYTKERRDGYAIVKEFYSPDYSSLEKNHDKDNRYTLYWSGDIAPSKDGKYRFEFYNNDISKKLRLLIQGISSDGELIYKQIVIE
ncbi:MAG: MG2 domain-containing protein [Chitinophagaceae bacterium]